MESLGLNGWDIVDVLSDGWDCSRSRRHKDTMERCLEQRRKVIRAVAMKGPYDMEGEIEEAYYLIHVSIEAQRKRQHTQDGV